MHNRLRRILDRIGRGSMASQKKHMVRLSSGEIYWSGRSVGGSWDKVGSLQFRFLVEQGLEPHHRLLDIGCGSLRGGVHFVKYLDNGNYYGVEEKQWLLDAAVEIELPRRGLSDKVVHLANRGDFNFSVFETGFDYVLAQSVFSHLTWNSIQVCLANVEKVLQERGTFYATFFEDRNGDHRAMPMYHTPGGVVTYPDRNPFHYDFGVFVELAKRTSLQVTYIGPWNHPRSQMMLEFKKPPRPV
jgi:hypothetical protein